MSVYGENNVLQKIVRKKFTRLVEISTGSSGFSNSLAGWASTTSTVVIEQFSTSAGQTSDIEQFACCSNTCYVYLCTAQHNI